MSTAYDPLQQTSGQPASPGGRRRRRAPSARASSLARQSLIALGLMPAGILMALVLAVVITSAFGLPIFSEGGDAAVVTPSQEVIRTGSAIVVALAAPVTAVVLAVRAAVAGHPRGILLVLLTTLVLGLLLVFPAAWNHLVASWYGGVPSPSSHGWTLWFGSKGLSRH